MSFFKRKIFYRILVGPTLTSLFFYPLISSLYDEIWYLQWSRMNTLELVVAFVLISILFYFLLCCAAGVKNSLLRVGMGISICVLPVFSFFIHIARQMGLVDFLNSTAEAFWAHPFILSLCIGMAMIFAGILVNQQKIPVTRLVKIGLLILFFINIPIIFTIVYVGCRYDATTQIGMDELLENTQVASSQPQRHVIILLFDEMSYRYLYADGKIRNEYPHFSELSTQSTNYHNAKASGTSTFPTIPNMIAGIKDLNVKLQDNHIVTYQENGKTREFAFDEHNFFARAQRKGFKTAVFGPYLPYCELLKSYVDYCMSYSVYNYGNLRSSFSVFNPIATNIILWPQQLPFGWFKRPLYAYWQKRGIEKVTHLSLEALKSNQPLMLFTHFYIPHLPFAFDAHGYRPASNPFLENDENYIRQLGYVDTVLGMIMDELKRLGKFDDSTIVIRSDHDYRKMTPVTKYNEIPLIIKMAGQKVRQDVHEKVHAGRLIHALFQ